MVRSLIPRQMGENGDILFNPVALMKLVLHLPQLLNKISYTEAAITYDESVHTVTVTVTKDATGQLNADVQYDGKGYSYFTNTYTPPRHLNSCSSNN